MKNPLAFAIGSLIISVVVLALKYAAYSLTGSVALYSDALESIINVATAVLAIVSVRIAAAPADANHPYGHHKAEYLSAVTIGVLILIAAISIMYQAGTHILSPKPLNNPTEGLVVNILASLLNAAWSFTLIRAGRRLHSAALYADGKHLFADVLTSAGVFVGLLFALVTGWLILDSLLAMLVALHVLKEGFQVIRENIGVLMDEAIPAETLTRLRNILQQLQTENPATMLEVHDLRTRQAGKMMFIDFHLIVPGSLNVRDSHSLCDTIEKALRSTLQTDGKQALISIHVEPEENAELPLHGTSHKAV